jgi:hypothetical protein
MKPKITTLIRRWAETLPDFRRSPLPDILSQVYGTTPQQKYEAERKAWREHLALLSENA